MTVLPDPIVTARMLGRQPGIDDAGRLDELLNDPAVARTMGGRRTSEAIQATLQWHIDAWARDGFGPWLLFDRSTGAFIGRGGLSAVTVLGEPEVEVMYALRPDYWSAGLATEIVLASIDLAFNVLDRESVVGFTLVDNVASRHVLVKCGLTYERDFTHADLPHVLFRRRRSDGPSAGDGPVD